jgi:hypothetical protein
VPPRSLGSKTLIRSRFMAHRCVDATARAPPTSQPQIFSETFSMHTARA